jgi:uncharacterized protein YndB with AHSA1/START domain
MIDTSRIPAAGGDIRSLRKEVEVAVPPGVAWSAWASAEGIATWWNPPGSRIELRVGGPFELFFSLESPDGSRGSEGCRYLSYVPGEMISFTWNAPPHLPLRESHTWVVITFTPANESRARTRLVHTGFLEGEDWDDYMAYFDDAWSRVLERFAEHWQAT